MIKKLLFILLILSFKVSQAQTDCFLGVGGKDDKTIATVFKLDSIQVTKMKKWGAELRYSNSLLIDQANYLVKKNEESSPEVLKTVAVQYQKLLDSMQNNLRLIDKRMLGIFNDEQYNLYLLICNQLSINPLYPTYVYTVSVDEK